MNIREVIERWAMRPSYSRQSAAVKRWGQQIALDFPGWEAEWTEREPDNAHHRVCFALTLRRGDRQIRHEVEIPAIIATREGAFEARTAAKQQLVELVKKDLETPV